MELGADVTRLLLHPLSVAPPCFDQGVLISSGNREEVDQDNGPGIPEDRIAKILAPYFTTKAAGTGLGLATTRRIAEEHAGRLEVHSEPGRGSDFVICLPRTG